jgi:hypothetical protein
MNYKTITHHICSAIHYNSIATLSKQLISNTMQPHYNCNHDIMLRSLIVIHLLKCDMWNYKYFWIQFIFE